MLEGLNVVEYATYIAAPGAGGIMADWGANVIKIEPPGGDPIRRFFDTIGSEQAANPVFELDNRGKKSVILDTTQEAGKEALRRLAAKADVFLTNVRPGGLSRAGLDYDGLSAANPKIIYASVTGYGLEGAEANRPGFDMAAFWSRTGFGRLTAPKGVDPFPIRTAVGDHICSLSTASAILAALYERDRTGKGRLVETSLVRAAVYAMGSDMAIQLRFGKLASTRPREAAINPIANFFRTRDERWVCVLPRQSEKDWGILCDALDAGHLKTDPRFIKSRDRSKNGPALVAEIDALFAERDFADIGARFDKGDLVWAPFNTPAEAAADPQLMAAGCFVETPVSGGDGTFRAPAGPARFHGASDGPKGSSPRPGEHTALVLRGAGFGDDEVAAMMASGAAA